MSSIFLLLVLSRISCLANNKLSFAGSELELKLADLEKSYIVSEVLQTRDHTAKCRLSQLEEEISRIKKNTYPLHLRLRDLKKKYPGDKFSRLEGSWCEDVSDVKCVPLLTF